MRFPGARAIAAFLALCMLSAGLLPPCAEAGTPLRVRRTFAVLFLGGSGYLAVKSLDYRRDANRLYDRYKAAANGTEASQLFKRTSDRDTKSQMSIVLSAALLVAGLRLLLSSGSEKKGEEPAKIQRRFGVDAASWPGVKALGLELRRDF